MKKFRVNFRIKYYELIDNILESMIVINNSNDQFTQGQESKVDKEDRHR